MFDPKLANETEVKAQVRLKFNNINKQTMIVTRSLQLTQKKAKTEMKTLESLLVTKDPVTGEVKEYMHRRHFDIKSFLFLYSKSVSVVDVLN